jgi:hypothetical protein
VKERGRPGRRVTGVIRFDAAQLPSETKETPDLKVVWPIVHAGPARQGRRRHADTWFGCGMSKLGMVRLIDSARVIDQLVADGCLRHEATLQWHRHRRSAFHLIVHLKVAVPPPRALTTDTPSMVSLDPGARHFQMWYDPRDGSNGELLAGWNPAARHTAGANTPSGTPQRRTRRRPPGKISRSHDLSHEDLDWWLSHYRKQNRKRRRWAERRRPTEPPPNGALAELDRRIDRRKRRARRRRMRVCGDGPMIYRPGMTGEMARRERQRLVDLGGATDDPTADPTHRRWLFNHYRRRIRNRRAAYWRDSDRLDGWRTSGHYDAIGFLSGHHTAAGVVVPEPDRSLGRDRGVEGSVQPHDAAVCRGRHAAGDQQADGHPPPGLVTPLPRLPTVEPGHGPTTSSTSDWSKPRRRAASSSTAPRSTERARPAADAGTGTRISAARTRTPARTANCKSTVT